MHRFSGVKFGLWLVGLGLVGCGSGNNGLGTEAGPLVPGADATASSEPPMPDSAAADTVLPVDSTATVTPPEAGRFETPGDLASPSPFDLGMARVLGELPAKQLHDMLPTKDFLMIDVHTPNAGSIPQTDARVAYDDLPALVAFIGPNLDSKVVLTCLSGHMSKTAGDALVAQGYRNISELTGGMNAWTSAGYALIRLDGGL